MMIHAVLTGKTKGLFAFLLLFLLLSPPVLSARTVSLVYDDSGSMLGRHRWTNANYAVQVLSALLKEGDDLFCVRMNGAPGGELFTLHQGQRRISLKKIRTWPAPIDGAKTPYAAVETAARSLVEQQGESRRELGISDSDWLIIITDGAFQKTDDKLLQKQYYQRVEKHAASFFGTRQGRASRVAFLLIGADADAKTAGIWKSHAPIPEQVGIFRSGDSDIAGAMEKIVRQIAGRDEHTIQPKIKGNTVSFSSIFPLNRFTVFEQRNKDNLAEIVANGVHLPDGNGSAEINQFTLQTPHTKKVWGRAAHIGTTGVIGSGEYSITFDRDISKRGLNLLVEPSVDFRVEVLGEDGTALSADSTGTYKLCHDSQVRFRVNFMSVNGGKWVDLPIGKKVATGLAVEGSMAGKSLHFSFDEGLAAFLSEEVKVAENTTMLQVEAKYPGYFHKRSTPIPIESETCERDVGFQHRDIVIPVRYSDEKNYKKVDSFQLNVTGSRIEEKVFVSAPGLPKGIQVELQGRQLIQGQGSVEISQEPQMEVIVSANRDFSATEPVTLHLEFATDNPRVKLHQPGPITLKPQPRRLTISPVEKSWSCKFYEIGEAAGPTYEVLADGKRVGKEQLAGYSMAAVTDRRIRVEAVPGKDGQGFQLEVNPFTVKGLTDVGEIPVSLQLRSPFAGEEVTLEVQLQIEELSLWQRLRMTLLIFAGILILLMWLIGCIRKNRFSGSSYIEYMEKKIGLSQRRRPTLFYLAAGKSRRGKLLKLLVAYCWPFGSEKQSVEGMVFHANYSKNSILLSEASQSSGMKVGTRKLTKSDAGKEKVMMTSGEKITVVTNSYQKTYTFKNQ